MIKLEWNEPPFPSQDLFYATFVYNYYNSKILIGYHVLVASHVVESSHLSHITNRAGSDNSDQSDGLVRHDTATNQDGRSPGEITWLRHLSQVQLRYLASCHLLLPVLVHASSCRLL